MFSINTRQVYRLRLLSLGFWSFSSFAQNQAPSKPGLQDRLSNVFSSGDLKKGGGAGSTGGGDLPLLIETLKPDELPPNLNSQDFRLEFVKFALLGIGELEKYAQMGWTFENQEKLTLDDIRIAKTITNNLKNELNGLKFSIDDELVNPDTGSPRLAENTKEGHFKLNSKEWSLLDKRYPKEIANQFRALIAVHEVLQQPPLNKEGTGNFPFTSKLVKTRAIRTEPMRLGSQFSGSARIEIKKGILQQASCNTKLGTGDALIRLQSVGQGEQLTQVIYDVDVLNPELCLKSASTPNGEPLLVEHAFNNVFGVPSIAVFAFRCELVNGEESCGLIDFQALPGESVESFYFGQQPTKFVLKNFRAPINPKIPASQHVRQDLPATAPETKQEPVPAPAIETQKKPALEPAKKSFVIAMPTRIFLCNLTASNSTTTIKVENLNHQAGSLSRLKIESLKTEKNSKTTFKHFYSDQNPTMTGIISDCLSSNLPGGPFFTEAQASAFLPKLPNNIFLDICWKIDTGVEPSDHYKDSVEGRIEGFLAFRPVVSPNGKSEPLLSFRAADIATKESLLVVGESSKSAKIRGFDFQISCVYKNSSRTL